MERLGRERLVVLLGLCLVAGLAWLWLWHAPMDGMQPMGAGLAFAMWAVMMAAMMLPGATPTILLYGAMVRKNRERGSSLPAVWTFVAGYLLVWSAFSLGASLLQGWLQDAALLSPMMVSSSKGLSALLLVAAGAYQLTPLKERCLAQCRQPAQFLMTHWRGGRAGALHMGVAHGAYCVGCCWMLMLLLFAVGVMNLGWVAAITAFVFLEKLLPAGRLASRFAGAALLGLGAALLAS